jgi:hypothetical protein
MNTIQNLFAVKKKVNRTSPHRTPTLLSLLAILALALIFWWIHVQHTEAKSDTIAGSNADMYVYHLPVRDFGFSRLNEGKVPLYNPYTNCGMPFLATYQAALFYPLNFPHLFLAAEPAMSLIYLIHIFLAGVFMFLWMRELRVREVAALFAGTAFMLCAFVTCILTWPHIVLTHVWIPLIFLLTHRAFNRGRFQDMILLGAAVGSQFLAGYMQGFVYTLYGVFAYLFYLTVVKLEQYKPGLISVGRSFIVTLLGLSAVPALLTAIQWIPTLELSGLSTRSPGGLTQHAILFGGSLYPSTFLAALINPESFTWYQYTLYPGAAALLLAAFAFVQRERWRQTFFFAAMAVVASLIAFGAHTSLFRLYMNVPTGDWFRLPNRLLILTAFSIATLAGIGCHHLLHSVLAQPARVPQASIRLGIFIALSAFFILLLPKSAGIYVFLLLIGCLLVVRARSTALAGLLATALLALDLTLHIANPVTYPWITRRVFPELSEAKAFLQEKVGNDRIHIFHAKNDWKNFLFNSNYGMIERIRETSGYESLSLQRFAEFCAFMETGGDPSYDLPFTGSVRWNADSRYPNMLNLLGARYIVEDPGRDLYPEKSPANKMPASFNLRKVFSGDVNIYENPDALPHAFFASDVEVIPEKHAILPRLAGPAFDYKNVVIIEEQPGQLVVKEKDQKRAEVTVKSETEDAINVIVDAPADGFVFLNEIFSPGWQVTVDGREAKLYKADYLFMGVLVEAGRHVIDMKYLPSSYRTGKWVSLISTMLFALLFAFDVARRRAKNMSPWEAEAKMPALLGKKKALFAASKPVKKPGQD